MPDREKIIKEYEFMVRDFCPACTSDERYLEVMKAVLDLLKEQDAVEPKQVDLYGKDEWWGLVCVCPDCKAEWMSDKADTHFCPKCGRSVKWE